ncbi:Lrp/AsnC family transcriptional regulator [Salsuginibacillus kocurii]|uniref:Lrp/AsnC family transcriptional regulator n=1 Tax=Salsuginibacillus kocurii TaxID=427078 RepID=UPI000379749A|nr:Lrp/AsnC family transcriptional regulator [Salsuginibacillus kocurii]
MEYLDELDRAIIRCLSQDGRRSFTDIAQTLDVTEKTIRTRYRNLTDSGLLQVGAIVNPVALGLKVSAIVLIKVNNTYFEPVHDVLENYQEVRYVSFTSGEYPLLIQVQVEDHEALTDFLKQLHQHEGIQSTNVMIQLEVSKNTFEIY